MNGNYVLTEELIDGFSELKTIYRYPAIFVNIETYNKMIHDINNIQEDEYIGSDKYRIGIDLPEIDITRIKINCNDIANFKVYMEDFITKNNINRLTVLLQYYSLENQEKLIYIAIIQLILKVMMIAICSIAIVSTVNIINASLVERKEDFNILHRLGTTKGNIRKMLIYEGIYMFLKALIISIILSIPIIYAIIKQIEKVVIINKLLAPFGEIGIFVAILFAITILIMLYSSKMIKEE